MLKTKEENIFSIYEKNFKKFFGIIPKEISVKMKHDIKTFKIVKSGNDISNGIMDYIHLDANLELWTKRKYYIQVK